MVLVGEEKQLGRYATYASCGEGAFCLGVLDAEVLLTVYAEDGGVPTVDIEVRRGFKHLCTLALCILVPGCLAHIPVGEPQFLCFHILLLGVEDTIVRYEGLETLLMIACQPIYAISTEACTYGTKALGVYPWFLCNIVYGREIVLHALTRVVTADLLQPFHAEAGETTTVGSYDNITLGCHNLEVPTIAPELANG